MRRLMAVGLAVLGLSALWTVYLVPVASVLNVGFGPDGFRQYQPYVYARLRGTGPTIGGPGEYAVSVASCLPEGSTAWLLTAGGERLNVAGRIDSEVDTEQHWLFPLPKDDPPVRLVVRAGGVEYQWSLTETDGPRYESTPWWYRIAPTWSKRSLMRRVGLGL